MKTLQNLCCLAFILLISSCTITDKPTIEEEQEKVRQVFNSFVKAVEAGDVDAYVSHLTDDFIGYDAGSPPIADRDALRTMLTGFFAKNTFKVSNYKSQEVIISDGIAVHRHKGFITIVRKKDSTKTELEVKYLDVLEKNEKGEWKIKIHSVSPNS